MRILSTNSATMRIPVAGCAHQSHRGQPGANIRVGVVLNLHVREMRLATGRHGLVSFVHMTVYGFVCHCVCSLIQISDAVCRERTIRLKRFCDLQS